MDSVVVPVPLTVVVMGKCVRHFLKLSATPTISLLLPGTVLVQLWSYVSWKRTNHQRISSVRNDICTETIHNCFTKQCFLVYVYNIQLHLGLLGTVLGAALDCFTHTLLLLVHVQSHGDILSSYGIVCSRYVIHSLGSKFTCYTYCSGRKNWARPGQIHHIRVLAHIKSWQWTPCL